MVDNKNIQNAEKYKKSKSLTFKRKQLWNIIVKNFNKFKSSEDTAATKDMVLSIIVGGILLNFGATLFNFPISLLNIISFGCAYWFFENKLLEMTIQIISSFQIVRVYK